MSIPVSALQNLVDLRTPPEEIRWRSGQRLHPPPCDSPCHQPHAQLAYIDARYVMSVLDTLVGPTNWQRVHTAGPGQTVFCGIGIAVHEDGGVVDGPPNWVWKWDGAGETDIEGEKGAVSDSFKRAAVSWGIGRDLYSMKPQAPVRSAPAAATPSAPATRVPSSPATAGSAAGAGADPDALCPVHAKPWTLKPAGSNPTKGTSWEAFWKCDGKFPDGSYCKAKPTKAWQAKHEA